jgi:hypothetical protein
MALDYFRILKGLQIDETVVVVTGSIDPSAVGFAASMGSLYLRDTGQVYTKTGPANTDWTLNAASSLQLYDENPVAEVAPNATGNNAVAIGSGATASGDDAMAHGLSTTAQGDGSVALGSNATALSDNSIALGNQSLARHLGAEVLANNRFGSTGDAQAGRYLLRTETGNAVFKEVFLDGNGGTQQLVLPDDSTWNFKIRITGHRTDASDGHAGYEFNGIIYRASGAATTAFTGVPGKSVIAESNAPWDAQITADTVGGALKIEVKGQAGKTVRWLALVETVEITN